jgi:tRNA(Ile)-lysidine synthase
VSAASGHVAAPSFDQARGTLGHASKARANVSGGPGDPVPGFDMTITDRIRRTVRTHGLFGSGSRVVVALSGGADSVALVHLLRELEAAEALRLAGVAHFNHQLREGEADADEAFCRALAADQRLTFETGRADVRAAAGAARRSIEDVARQLRYAFLDDAASRLGADAIAVAHTLDDQAETFLLRLIRGSGPRGLAGIHPKAGRVVRPLIDVRRVELRGYLAARDLPFREDATNADLSIPRNRVRHQLIPYLEEHFSPGIVQVLAREAAIARDDEARLSVEAIDLAQSVVLQASEAEGPGGPLRIDTAALTSLPAALAARVARIALERGAPGRFAGYGQVERLLEFARSAPPGSAMSLPGRQALRVGRFVEVGPEPPRGGEAGANAFRFPLSIPGEVVLVPQGWVVAAALDSQQGDSPPGELTVRVLASAVQTPLMVRSRLPGDRLRPAGMGGRHKKLQDLFVDRKVPRGQRDRVPLVVDAGGRIVWVVGEAVGEEFRSSDPSACVILLKARRLPFDSGGQASPARDTR